MIAAFLIAMSCTAVPVSAEAPAHNLCQRYEVQSWEGPTAAELESCATMAESLSNMDKPATCEIVPMADGVAGRPSMDDEQIVPDPEGDDFLPEDPAWFPVEEENLDASPVSFTPALQGPVHYTV